MSSPFSRVMKPKPLAALNHLTVPVSRPEPTLMAFLDVLDSLLVMMQAIKMLKNEIKNSGNCAELNSTLAEPLCIFRLTMVAIADVIALIMIIFINWFMVVV